MTRRRPFLTPAGSSRSILSTNTRRAQLSGFLVKLARHSEARQLIETGQRLASEFGYQSSGVLAQAERELSRPARSGPPPDARADIESNRDPEANVQTGAR